MEGGGAAVDADAVAAGDVVDDLDVGDVGVAVVKVDEEAAGGLIDAEVEQVAVGDEQGAVGVADRDGDGVFAKADAVGLTAGLVGAADGSGLAVDREVEQLERFFVAGVEATLRFEQPSRRGGRCPRRVPGICPRRPGRRTASSGTWE